MENNNEATAIQTGVAGPMAKIRQEWMEGLFYFVLLVSVTQAGLIVWDLLTMMPWFTKLAGLTKPNTFTGTADLSNLYLALLAGYGGVKEILRWSGHPAYMPAITPEEEAQQEMWFYRGEMIVLFWMGLTFVSEVICAFHLIPRMPYELVRTGLQTFAIWAGTSASRTAHKTRMKKKAAQAGIAGDYIEQTVVVQQAGAKSPSGFFPNDFSKTKTSGQAAGQAASPGRRNDLHKQAVLDYMKKNNSINTKTCCEITTLNSQQSYRLLSDMESDKLLKSKGDKKGRIYVPGSKMKN